MNDLKGFDYIRRNLAEIRARLAAAAARGGHPVPELVAVTKSASPEEVSALAEMADIVMAENRVQLLRERLALFQDRPAPAFDLIGSLQTNKVKYVIGSVRLIESLDSLRLADEIERISAKRGLVTDALVEVNSAREAAKGGVMPEDVEGFLRELAAYPHIRVMGLMTMGAPSPNPEELRPAFRQTRALFLQMAKLGLFATDSPTLSMGMSDSFEVAAEEGASMVRIGRALFRSSSNFSA